MSRKLPPAHDEVPNLIGRCDPIVEQAIRNLYLRFYKFGGTTIINQPTPTEKKRVLLPSPGVLSEGGGGQGGEGVFQVRAEGYGALTVDSLSGSGIATFIAPSVDETDAEWYAKGGNLSDSPDPVTMSLALVGESRWGMQIEMLDKGSGYSSSNPPTITLTGLNNTGLGAVATPVIDNLTHTLEAITVSPSGYAYVPPVIVGISGGAGTGAKAIARLGRQWGVGDYLLINDTNVVDRKCAYEILRITELTPISTTSATFKVERGQFGSRITQHGDGLAIYRLIPRRFTQEMKAETQTIPFYWPNMTVPAVTGILPGKAPTTINFNPEIFIPGSEPPVLDARTNPPTPGLRTMEGAAYISMGAVGGLSVGQNATIRIPGVQAWQSVRCLYARVGTAPTGPVQFLQDSLACIVIYVCYISPSGTVGLIDVLVIDSGSKSSFSSANPPDGRQMPYHLFFPKFGVNKDWPPNRLPVVPNALDLTGKLIKPVSISDITPSQTVVFHPDGEIDFRIAQVGTGTAGSNLSIAVQT